MSFEDGSGGRMSFSHKVPIWLDAKKVWASLKAGEEFPASGS